VSVDMAEKKWENCVRIFMKKLLGILVLGLLLSSNANAHRNKLGEYVYFCQSTIGHGQSSQFGNAPEIKRERCAYFEKELSIPEYLINGFKYWGTKMTKKKFIEWQVDKFKLFNLNTDTIFETLGGKPKTVAKKPKKKEPPKKQITKAPEIDGSLLTIGSGSGFYINNKGYALTNNHVVDICKQMVAVVDGREILLRVLNTDKINDVAVLKTNYKSKSFIKINEDGAKLGENVIAVGYPLAGQLSDSVKITRGIVSSLSGLDNNIGQIQIDAALQPGNSGGPVLNEKGALIGIASAGLNKLLMAKEAKYIPENVNFAVSSPIVVNILKSKKIKYTTPSMFSGTYSNTELAELGDSSTIQLFCRNTRTAYNRLKRSNKYSTILLDLD